jgi:hypothetical protein
MSLSLSQPPAINLQLRDQSQTIGPLNNFQTFNGANNQFEMTMSSFNDSLFSDTSLIGRSQMLRPSVHASNDSRPFHMTQRPSQVSGHCEKINMRDKVKDFQFTHI